MGAEEMKKDSVFSHTLCVKARKRRKEEGREGERARYCWEKAPQKKQRDCASCAWVGGEGGREGGGVEEKSGAEMVLRDLGREGN